MDMKKANKFFRWPVMTIYFIAIPQIKFTPPADTKINGGIYMRYIMSRKYPITHMKKGNAQEKILDVSAVTAIATIAAVFVRWSYKWVYAAEMDGLS